MFTHRVQTKRDVYPVLCREFSAAWNAVAYRYLACTEHHETFTSSLNRAGDSPPFSERYVQERELFAFFYTGLSTVECFCYGLFIAGHILKPANFPFSSDRQRRAVTPKHTLNCLTSAFAGDGLVDALRSIVQSADLEQWSDVRNVLTHRANPGRQFNDNAGEPSSSVGVTEWFGGLVIETLTTATLHDWLTQSLILLASATENFASVHFT